ncbi:YncE family protein [Streptomyces sp. BA2]|uniref:YncE family protein n=1 Tax=Streptomyces sp. BA2 TaxID=436595 RepID=UPI001320F15B|nr:YncE family protein [Streptomyces sp. BA2]MWA15077.1 YncE family protein [Streptomyces sp. BA2]
MSSTIRRARRTTAITVSLAAGSALVPTGTAGADTAGGGSPTTTVPIRQGLYQSAYSERNDALWMTSSVGMPPATVTDSRLLRVDPDTLKVEKAYAPPVTDAATGAVESVYGIAVDDEHNTVWTTNTRDNSVGVYSQRTGKRLATLPNVNHAREIVVDERRDTVWASSFADGSLVAFDSGTFKEKKRLTVPGTGPTGITVNERTGSVYAADYHGAQIIEVSPRAESPRLIPAGKGPLSIALSKNGRTAYTADQTSGTVTVVDLRKGAVTRSVPTGGGTKSVAVDHRSGHVLAVNRTTATVTIVDPHKGAVVKSVATGANPNHVQVAEGHAYVVDKSGSGPAGEDLLTRVRLRR